MSTRKMPTVVLFAEAARLIKDDAETIKRSSTSPSPTPGGEPVWDVSDPRVARDKADYDNRIRVARALRALVRKPIEAKA